MQSFPITTPASALVYASVSPERSTSILSSEQDGVVDAIHQAQAQAAQDPRLNGQAARKAGA